MIFSTAMRSPEARAAFLSGVRDTIIVIPSYLPFGLVCGMASVNAGLSIGASLALPALVFGGSAQAVLLQFVQAHASLWVAVLSGAVINLRMAVYSAAMARHVRHLRKPQRMLAAAFLVDHNFAFLQRRLTTHPHEQHLMAYYAGTSIVFWAIWLAFCAIGIFAGNVVPAGWQLDFAIPLCFMAMLAPSLRNLPMASAALASGIASVLMFALPLKLGLIAACLVGLAAGLFAQSLAQQPAVTKP